MSITEYNRMSVVQNDWNLSQILIGLLLLTESHSTEAFTLIKHCGFYWFYTKQIQLLNSAPLVKIW